MSSAVEAHVLERIAAAPVLREPFPHCVIDETFPADFYESIIDHWPQEESWEPLSASGRVRGYEERLVVLMDDRGFARLDASRRAFWKGRDCRLAADRAVPRRGAGQVSVRTRGKRIRRVAGRFRG